MTMNKITAILRKKNKGQYRLLGICIFLSVLLVSSFTFMFFSPSIQEFLPPGGDTRKLMWLMLGVVAIGCLFFTLYGSGLFFRKKSREYGVMLALGAQKQELAGQLLAELSAVVGKYVITGILLAVPVSYLIWKLFQVLIIHTPQMRYRLGIAGMLGGLCFAAVLSFGILIMGIRFIQKTNIMEILNASRKTEMVREIRPWTGKLGILFVILGLFLAMVIPQLTVRLFHQGMPGIWNVTYLLCVAGLYLLMLSAVAHSAKGRHPEKYYNNIISTSLMRFTARQTTRTMCVIALLVFVMILSAFWGVMYYYSAMEGGSEAPYDYSFHHSMEEQQLSQKDIQRLAEEYEVNVSSYEELESLELVVHYTGRDMDENRKYFDTEYEKLASFVSASDFTRISGIPVSLKKGEYLTITISGFQETIWVAPDCLNLIEQPVTGTSIIPEFAGTVTFDNLAISSDPFAFLLSDEDYRMLAEDLPKRWKERHVLFNTEHVMETYDFADAWKREWISRATALSDHYALYDAHEEELALAAGEDYAYAGEVGLSPDNTHLMGNWKYAPFSKVLRKSDAMELVAVFVLLSIYIAVISLASAGIMSYVRSITIATDHRQLFEDLRKLGANDDYEERIIRVQLRKIFAYPVAAGCILTGTFSLFLTFFNDMRLQEFEIRMLLMEVLLMVFITGVMYEVYRAAFQRMKQIVGICSSGSRAF